MAVVPISGTNIRLLTKIPFSNDYKHTRYFENKTAQSNYFWGKPVAYSVAQANFQRIEGRHFIKVDKSIDELHNVNYLMFQNRMYNDKTFYAFVTKLEYAQRNTTYVYFELDVYQTWCWDITFKPSYVVREHCKLWNADGTPVVNTVDEGLDYGTEYSTINYYRHIPNNGYKFLVIISKTTLHEDIVTNPGDIQPSLVGTMQPLTYYLVPYKDGKLQKTSVELPSIGRVNINPPSQVLLDLFKSTEAVNNIVSIYSTENIGLDVTITGNDVIVFPTDTVLLDVNVSGTETKMIKVGAIERFRPTATTLDVDKYANFGNIKESKLLMYPYSFHVLDDFKGNRVDIKTEYIGKKRLEILSRGSLGTSNKVSYYVSQYNQRNISENLDKYLSTEHGIIDSTPNDVSVLTDHLASFIQGNRNSIQNQRNIATFEGVTDTIGGVASTATSVATLNTIGAVGGINRAVKGAGMGVLKLQGINAKLRDIDNKPPEIAKMGSNTSYDFGNRYNGIWVLQKQIKGEYITKLTDFFNMYGYKVNEVKIPNFNTRQYWNYVQTESCVITGNFNNEDLQEIKDVFDNGITFWHTDDIGNYYLNNKER